MLTFLIASLPCNADDLVFSMLMDAYEQGKFWAFFEMSIFTHVHVIRWRDILCLCCIDVIHFTPLSPSIWQVTCLCNHTHPSNIQSPHVISSYLTRPRTLVFCSIYNNNYYFIDKKFWFHLSPLIVFSLFCNAKKNKLK